MKPELREDLNDLLSAFKSSAESMPSCFDP